MRKEKRRGQGKIGCWESRTEWRNLNYQRDDDLAVTAGGEGVLAGELLPDLLVVVDLPIGLKSNQREKHSSWIVAYVSCGRSCRVSARADRPRRLVFLTTTTTVRSSLKSGWSPDSGETTASRCWARKLPSCWYTPDQSGPRCLSLHTPHASRPPGQN